MAPIKFEENIKEKLEQRSLQPSANAWQNLEQKLNVEAKKRQKNKFWWFGIAACIIGLLFVFQQFVSLNKTNDYGTPILVESESDTLNNRAKPSLSLEETPKVVEENPEEISVDLKFNKPASNTTRTKNHIVKQDLTQKVAVTKNTEKIPAETKASINFKGEDVATVTPVINPSENKDTLIAASETSDLKIEALLNAAKKDIQLNNGTLNSISIDANALLEDVETEMPPSLRGQLFKVIEKNFKTAKTAVANRNN
ncbi:hypothetical protein ACFS5M_00265 [Lacinutrix iliipiscaria]|uniref:Uncharacterized protein n=1 Tax=Lacinutrix iliipiscaria TaxID=1230532 RepID=A0ABW5WJM9_9FLAO